MKLLYGYHSAECKRRIELFCRNAYCIGLVIFIDNDYERIATMEAKWQKKQPFTTCDGKACVKVDMKNIFILK